MSAATYAPPPTLARTPTSPVVHYLNRGAATWRTMCGRDAQLMARYRPSDLPGGERAARYCAKCSPRA